MAQSMCLMCVRSVVGSAAICCVIHCAVRLAVHHRDTQDVIHPAGCPVWVLIPFQHDVIGFGIVIGTAVTQKIDR